MKKTSEKPRAKDPFNTEPQSAKLFMNGRSQAVRLPKEFRFEGDEVYIYREGDRIVLSSKRNSWKSFFEDKSKPSSDFMDKREDSPPQEREIF